MCETTLAYLRQIGYTSQGGNSLWVSTTSGIPHWPITRWFKRRWEMLAKNKHRPAFWGEKVSPNVALANLHPAA